MPNIFDLIKSQEQVAYWNIINQSSIPFLGEELFDVKKQLEGAIRYIKGAKGSVTMLKQAAFDTKAVPRPRIGFDTIRHEMPFFKESKMVDEKLQQQLNMVLATGNQAYIDSVMTNIMDDAMELLQSARISREAMIWSALSTGSISMTSNGTYYDADYGMPTDNKVDATKAWSDVTADIIGDIRDLQDTIEIKTGVRPTRMVVSRKVLNQMTANTNIKKTVFSAGSVDAYLGESKLKEFLMSELGVTLATYDKRYLDNTGEMVKFVSDDVAILLPEMKLGDFVFGETPAENSLNAGISPNTSVTDTGVAVTTIKVDDPVTVETVVSQLCMPSIPHIDKVGVIDVTATA